MPTITLSRQLASLGVEIARLAADRLGYRLVRREVINEAARRAGAPEMALAAIDELGLLNMCPSDEDCHAYHRALRQVLEEFAAVGNAVLVGRAGQAVLHGRPQVLHVRVIAPLPLRVERLRVRLGITREQASAQIRASDSYRRNYLKRFYDLRWDDPELYDLTISTEQLSPEAGADLIVAALARPLPGDRAAPLVQNGPITTPR